MKAELEDGGKVELTGNRMRVQYGGEVPDETVELSEVESASYTRPMRSDYHGALAMKLHNSREVLLRLREEDGGKLLAALRQAKEDRDNPSARLDDDGGPPINNHK